MLNFVRHQNKWAAQLGGCSAALACVLVLGCEPPVGRQLAGAAAFVDITDSAFLTDNTVAGWPGLALFDFDNDGDIDVFVGNILGFPNLLFRNDGNGVFSEVGNEAGIRFTADSHVTAGVGDFDNDGWLDLILGRQIDQGGEDDQVFIRYLKNIGPDESGTVRFADGTEEAGLAGIDYAAAIGVGDIDNDGLLDLYVGRYDFKDLIFEDDTYLPDTPNVLMRNTGVDRGIPVFEDITESAGVAGTRIPGLAPSTAHIQNRMPTFAVYFTDVNEDGWQDLFALQEIPGGVDLFINNGDLTFTLSQEDLLNKHGGWMGIAGADFNRDGHIDYFLTNVGADAIGQTVNSNHVTSAWRRPNGTPYHRLLLGDGRGTVADVASDVAVVPGILPPTNILRGQGLAAYEFGFGCAWLDVENDGWPDLTWTGNLVAFDDLGDGPLRVDFHGVGRLLTNNGDGDLPSMTDATAPRGLFNWDRDLPIAYGYSRQGRAVGAIDINGDGFADVCRTDFVAEGGFHCLLNPAVDTGHWIVVRLNGKDSNRFGIGSRVEITTESGLHVGEVVTTTGAFTAVHPQVHFGLGSAAKIDDLTVRWPSGTTSFLNDVAVDQVITIDE